MKSQIQIMETLLVDLALIALKAEDVSQGDKQRINHILGELQYVDQYNRDMEAEANRRTH